MSTNNTSANTFSIGKIILCIAGAIALFILIALLCNLLTFWIKSALVRVLVRELMLRAPLTLYLLHQFARRVIKTYDPAGIYGRMNLPNTIMWAVVGVFLPTCIWSCYWFFNLIIPFGHSQPLSTGNEITILVKWAAISLAAGITEELLFRGHLFALLRNRCSPVGAMVISSLLFGLVHISMLPKFSVGDILAVTAGGFLAGMMFSMIYLRSAAIGYAVLVHALWDVFFIGKIISIANTQADADSSILAFRLTTGKLWLSGGSFGIEAGIFSLVLYVIVILVLGFRHKHAYTSMHQVRA